MLVFVRVLYSRLVDSFCCGNMVHVYDDGSSTFYVCCTSRRRTGGCCEYFQYQADSRGWYVAVVIYVCKIRVNYQDGNVLVVINISFIE